MSDAYCSADASTSNYSEACQHNALVVPPTIAEKIRAIALRMSPRPLHNPITDHTHTLLTKPTPSEPLKSPNRFWRRRARTLEPNPKATNRSKAPAQAALMVLVSTCPVELDHHSQRKHPTGTHPPHGAPQKGLDAT